MPSRSATPGRKPSTSASQVSAMRRATSAPPGLRRSNRMERRPRPSALVAIASARPPVPERRSIRMTSAPRSASSIPRNGTGPIAGNSRTRTPSSGPVTRRLLDGSEPLAVLGLLAQLRVRLEPWAVPGRELVSACHEGADAARVGVDVLQHATGPRREADAHDRPDVGVGRADDDALLDAARRLDGLDDEHPFLQFVQVPPRRVAVHGETRGEARPQADPLARLVVVVEPCATQPAGPAQADHLLDDRLRRVAGVAI